MVETTILLIKLALNLICLMLVQCFLWAAAAAAKSLHSCPTLCDPIDGSPPGSPVSWDSPGKNTGESNFTQISKTY